jgi:PAT family beta-lactamase induction signal transducer AmpG
VSGQPALGAAGPAEGAVAGVARARLLHCVLAGFAAGVPLFTLTQLVPAWLETEGVDLTTIGLMSLVGLPYTLKPLWAPALDRVAPWGARRRAWSLLATSAVAVGIAGLGSISPHGALGAVVATAVGVAFASATLDIALDAWRRELLADAELGVGNALYVNAYKLSSLLPGSAALVLAETLPWSWVFPLVGAGLLSGVAAALVVPEPPAAPPATWREAVVAPFTAFFAGRSRVAVGWLLFAVLFKLGDGVATSLLTPFYLQTGFSLATVGTIAKLVGVGATVLGAFAGAALIAWRGLGSALWWAGQAQLWSLIGLAALGWAGPRVDALALAVAFEYLGVGMGSTALVSWLQSLTDRRHTAAQLALLTSLVALPRTVAAAGAGAVAETVGWPAFFLLCALAALPGVAMVPWVASSRHGQVASP